MVVLKQSSLILAMLALPGHEAFSPVQNIHSPGWNTAEVLRLQRQSQLKQIQPSLASKSSKAKQQSRLPKALSSSPQQGNHNSNQDNNNDELLHQYQNLDHHQLASENLAHHSQLQVDPANVNTKGENNNNNDDEDLMTRRQKLQQRVRSLARSMISPMPNAIASLLKEATMNAVDMAVEEVLARSSSGNVGNEPGSSSSALSTTSTTNPNAPIPIADNLNAHGMTVAKDSILSTITLDLVNEAFEPMERSLEEMELSLEHARTALTSAKSQASVAIEAIQAAAIAQAEGAASVVQTAEAEAERKLVKQIYATAEEVDVASLALEDLDFDPSEMAPPFINEDQCLVPGEPVVRVEKAPENSRRIFAGIDIMAPVDDVWKILTDYSHLQDVVPNLVVNDVLDTYDGHHDYQQVTIDSSKSDKEQCQQMAEQMKGAKLKQVGGAKVAGINFSARTTLEVREWPQGLPDFAHYQDEVWEGKTRDARAKEYTNAKLERYVFPRPFAVSSLPTKDISMQSIVNDDGEFRLYQGVWRMQPLPDCKGSGQSAMRLTYAVEISPRAYLPVQLVEGRIVKDLCNNLLAIRDVVEAKVQKSNPAEVAVSSQAVV